MRRITAVLVTAVAVATLAACTDDSGPKSTASTIPAADQQTRLGPGASKAEFEDAPALFATARIEDEGSFSENRYYEDDEPVAILADPFASPVIVPEDEGGDYSVSPDGLLVARRYGDEVRISATTTGLDVDTVALRRSSENGDDDWSPSFRAVAWSPDHRAIAFLADGRVYLHRIGGHTTSTRTNELWEGQSSFGFSSDRNATTLVACHEFTSGGNARWTITDSGREELVPGRRPCQVAQLMAGVRAPSALVSYWGGGTATSQYRIGPDGARHTVELPDGVAPRGDLYRCGVTYAVVSNGGSEPLTTWLFDAASGSVVAGTGSCPVASPKGDALAGRSYDSQEPYATVSSGGEVRSIPGAWIPLGWSADGTELLVVSAAGETQRVAVDTMTVERAAVQIKVVTVAETTSGSPPGRYIAGYCAVGATGKVILETDGGWVLYDVGSDSFLPVAARTDPNEHSVGAGCRVDAGNEYLLIGRKLVHLTTGHVARLPFIDLGSNSYEVYRWFGPETVTFGPRGPIALPAGS